MTFNLEKEGLKMQEKKDEESNVSKSKDKESLQKHYEDSIKVESDPMAKPGLK